MVQGLPEADRAMGELAGEGRRLPNLHLLFRPWRWPFTHRYGGTALYLSGIVGALRGTLVPQEKTRDMMGNKLLQVLGVPSSANYYASVKVHP